ncbi:putative bifunctional diguanylate cyclase/phosphodiesterase [Citreimonas sp.]|uniref:putative bifunctional diguanylate cyclase/phosphodiesterase n=1 Tax=Citreimonas sp. TaxID=3036715 RepID=UPI0040584925
MAIMCPIPENDVHRLAAIASLGIEDADVVRGLESVMRLAADIAQTPIALVSLVGETKQRFIEGLGLDGISETLREAAFCAHAIVSSDQLVVPDALKDPRFRDNPLVTGDPKIRAYAGSVLEPFEGMRVGTLCVIDRQPREFSNDVLERLAHLSTIANSLLLAHRDRVELRQREEDLRRKAETDPMTGLLNTSTFRKKVDQSLKSLSARSFAIVDVDFLKLANDRFGHPFGDMYLKTISRVLRDEFGEDAIVGRTGGDEFSILFEEGTVTAQMGSVDRVRSELRKRMKALGKPMLGGISVGLCAVPSAEGWPNAQTFQHLYQAADIALYKSKSDGRDTTVVYSRSMDGRLNLRAQRQSFGAAVKEGSIVTFFQPKVDLDTRAIVGFEALVRWQDPERGVLAPAEFSRLLDDRHVGPEITQMMIQNVIKIRAAWLDRGVVMPRVAVNITHHDLYDPDFLKTTEIRLKAGGLSLADLDFEITEEAILHKDDDQVRRSLKGIRDAGAEVALDDFGTGHATLLHLRDWPIDVLKIDQSFIFTLTSEPRNEAIVSSIVSIANKLGLKTIAEGVEQVDVAKALQSMGCQQAQGYLFGKPMDGDTAFELVSGTRLPAAE